MIKYSFRNDYSDVGNPIILEELTKHCGIQYTGYGSDTITCQLLELVREKTKQNVDIYLFSGGTQTNLTYISKVLTNYEAVISHKDGHINTHETGAVEGAGKKIIPVEGKNGKVYPEDVEKVISLHTENYMVNPKLVYISNSTESGTIYSLKELKELYEICQKYNLLLFLDGARLPVALTSEENDLTLELVAKYTDAFYLGGTKNGMPYGEMLIIKDDESKKYFSYHLKNKGAMLSKTFVLSILFKKFLENDLYLQLAQNANDTAKILREELIANNYEIVYQNPTNQIFVKIDYYMLNILQDMYNFEVWEKYENYVIIRLVTSWYTTKEACLELVKDMNFNRK